MSRSRAALDGSRGTSAPWFGYAHHRWRYMEKGSGDREWGVGDWDDLKFEIGDFNRMRSRSRVRHYKERRKSAAGEHRAVAGGQS